MVAKRPRRPPYVPTPKKPDGTPRLSKREYAIYRRCVMWGVEYTKVRRAEVFKRDRGICQLCGEPVNMRLRYPNPGSASIDHRVPISRGGPHTFKNCQLSHLRCNLSKGRGNHGG